MPPVKRKCCVPHCPNVPNESNKQFFKIGANLEERNKWRRDKAVAPKSQLLHCCEDHFDLPNDALNYIRYKYCPDTTKLKLRPDVLPHRKLPINVCRLCLNLIFYGDDTVDISEKKGGENYRIVRTLLPEIDLSLTVEPMICMKCFEPLERYHKIKQSALRSEIVVVNCIKSIVQKSPRRLMNTCEIDLFDEYNEIQVLQAKERDKMRQTISECHNEQIEKAGSECEVNSEEIVIELDQSENSDSLSKDQLYNMEKLFKSDLGTDETILADTENKDILQSEIIHRK